MESDAEMFIWIDEDDNHSGPHVSAVDAAKKYFLLGGFVEGDSVEVSPAVTAESLVGLEIFRDTYKLTAVEQNELDEYVGAVVSTFLARHDRSTWLPKPGATPQIWVARDGEAVLVGD
ncbi:MAG: hypothetical protein AAF532_17380 [Planctomycetota bacterium]